MSYDKEVVKVIRPEKISNPSRKERKAKAKRNKRNKMAIKSRRRNR